MSHRQAVDERLAALVGRQHGAVARRQLLEAGLTGEAVGRMTRSGLLVPAHRGVYLVGGLAGAIEPPLRSQMAAVLAGGADALLSHTSALALWEMIRTGFPAPVHVGVGDGGRARRRGIRFHRFTDLAAEDRTELHGIPVTTPGRSLVDAASLLGRRDLELAAATAEREGLLTGPELAALADRYPKRPGAALLRHVLGEDGDPPFTRSALEREAGSMIREAALPWPHWNVPFGPYELDAFWADLRVALELDGRSHSRGRRYEGDRRKDNWLRSRGIEVVRLTWRQVTRRRMATAVELGGVLLLARARREGWAGWPTGGGRDMNSSKPRSAEIR